MDRTNTGSSEAPRRRKPRNDRRRERNRRALLEATLELASSEGTGGLSVAAITRAAGMHSPAFYSYFDSVDACVRATAEHLLETVVTPLLDRQREAMVETPPDRKALLSMHLATLERARGEDLAFYRMFPGARFADTPIGEVVRAVVARSKRAWTEVVWDLAIRLGAGASALRELEAVTGALVEMTFVSLCRVAAGEIEDLEHEAALLERTHFAAIDHEIRRALATAEK